MSDELTKCAHCGAGIEGNAKGRPRKYCSDTHRVMACRARHRQADTIMPAEQFDALAASLDAPDEAPRLARLMAETPRRRLVHHRKDTTQ